MRFTIPTLAGVPYCKECGEEIYIAEFSDENIRRANERYRELKGLGKQIRALEGK